MVSLSEILTKIDGSADEMVRVMTEMIRIPALAPVNGGDGESKKADYLQSELVGFDSIVRVDVPDDVDPSVMRSNILAKKNGRKSGTVWIIAHMDVVPAGDPEMWDNPPFEPVFKDGKIYGRGTEDNGQSIISSMFASKFFESGELDGMSIGVAYVADEENSYTTILGSYDTNPDSYGYAIYGDLAAISSAPSTVFSNTGYLTCSFGDQMGTGEPGSHSISKDYAPFLYTSADAMSHEKGESGYTLLENAGVMDLCAVTTRLELDNYTGEYKYSYLFCANSADFFGNDALGNASFSNYEVMSALTENMIRSDEYASIELGSTSANSTNQGGKLLLDTTIHQTDYYENNVFVSKGLSRSTVIFFTVLVMLVPAVIGAVGIAVRLRRRFL